MIAYFTMEIGLEAAIATYAVGLGILAGDTGRYAADLRLPMVAVSLLHRRGYFHQHRQSVRRAAASRLVMTRIKERGESWIRM